MQIHRPFRRAIILPVVAVLGIAAVAAPAIGFAPVARAAEEPRLAAPAPTAGGWTNAALGLARASRQTPAKHHLEDGSIAVWVTLEGRNVELRLEPHSLRRPGAEAFAEGPGGTRTKIDLPPSRTYRGTVRGDADGVAAASIDGDAVRARIILDDGTDWYVQPLPGGLAGEHAIFRGADVAEPPGACAVEGSAGSTERQPSLAPQAQSSGCVEADVAFEADYDFYVLKGSSTTTTINDIDAVLNSIELIYARDAKISYRTTHYLIQTTNTSKYPSTDPDTKLGQFQTWWNANQGSVTRDIAHLMVGGNLNNGQLGVAYIAVVCKTIDAYGISRSVSANFASRVALTAHEFGHNWAASHCDGQPDCWIMCSSIGGCANDGTKLSTWSIQEIDTYRSSSSCLAAGTGVTTPLAPAGRNDRAVTLRATPVTINVLANDFDPNCQTVSVNGYTASTANGGGVSASGDNLVYTPATLFLGEDTFSYTVRDASGAQSTASVTVDVQDYRAADTATGAVAGLQARYYYVPILDGSLSAMPAMTTPYRVETMPTLSFPLTSGPFGESGLTDKVAARCTGTLTLPTTDTYTFYLTSDDGSKLYIDGQLRINNDGIHTTRELSTSLTLTAGAHAVRVDYYDATGPSILLLEMRSSTTVRAEIPASTWEPGGVQVAYYQLDSTILPPLAAMVPERTQFVSNVNVPFSWGNFAGSNRSRDVGAVYEGFLTVPSDAIYTFDLTSDNGSRLWIGDKLVIDNNGNHHMRSMVNGIALRAGAHKARIEYWNRDQASMLTIQVSSPTVTKQVVPASWWSHLQTFHVPTDYATLDAAITAATANTMVWVAAGTYTGTANKNLDLDNKSITLRGGGGAALTILDAQSSGRAFRFVNHTAPNAAIEGFTISNAQNTAGGVGGAMSFDASTLVVRDCFIKGNSNPGNGGALGFTGNSSPTFENCVITGNHASGAGGAIHAEATARPTFRGCTIGGNDADGAGGGAHAATGAAVSFDRTILWGNTAASSGSEAWTADATASLTFGCSDVRVVGVEGAGLETIGPDNLITVPGFCAPVPGTRAPTTLGGYRVVASSLVVGAGTPCGQRIGALGAGCTSTPTDVATTPGVPLTSLEQNVPNPFNPTTKIVFSLARPARAALRIHDVAGRLVATLVDRDLPAGTHTARWTGLDQHGRRVASGVYFYQLRIGDDLQTRSMVLLK
jgi:hypothetical protein